MRVGILGVAGRMGRSLVAACRSHGHEIVGGTLNPASNRTPPEDVPILDLATLVDRADVVIDFTHADAIAPHAEALKAGRAVWILGTTGLSSQQRAAVEDAASRIPVLYAEHFGLGMNLLADVARRLGAQLPAQDYDAEIVEMHHRQKVDAPSGSALLIGRALAEGRGVALEAVRDSGRDGHTGPRRAGAIGFASLRGGQVVGEHALILTSAEEQITLSHRVFDRHVFAAGAVRTLGWLAGRPPGLYTMTDVLACPTSCLPKHGVTR